MNVDRPKLRQCYMSLIHVLEGDFVRAGTGFKGPQYYSKVITIEWVDDNKIRVLTERGEYFGHPYQSHPGVLLREFSPRDKSGK